MTEENTLRTLNDLEKEQEEYDESYTIVSVQKLKTEAIKWVKEDLVEFNIKLSEMNEPIIMLRRWMKRLNITEDDLK